MKYGKIENGALKYAPDIIRKDNKAVYQPNHETYTENGYKPIVETPYPQQTSETEEMKLYTAGYIEDENQIVQTWVESELPEGGE